MSNVIVDEINRIVLVDDSGEDSIIFQQYNDFDFREGVTGIYQDTENKEKRSVLEDIDLALNIKTSSLPKMLRDLADKIEKEWLK